MPRQVVRSFGTCLSFNGSTSGIDCGAGVSLQTATFTITAWIKINILGSNQTITGDSGTGGTQGVDFRVNTTNNLELLHQNLVSIGTSTGTIPINTWTHVAVSYDASGNYAFYINGVASGSGTNLKPFNFNNFLIGYQAGGERYSGLMEEVRRYGVVLTGSQITNLFYGIDPPTANLQGYWKFDEGSGTSATDSSVNGNTGTITAGSYVTNPPLGITTRTVVT